MNSSKYKVAVFDPIKSSVQVIDQLTVPRTEFAVVPIPNGDVYVLGGVQQGGQRVVEKFDYAAFHKSESSR